MAGKYITDEEREKCRKVKEAFNELYEESEVMAVEAGRFGFVKLICYSENDGFDTVETYTDSKLLFESLWMEWRDKRLHEISKNTPIAEKPFDEIFECLPEERKKEFNNKKNYFMEKSEIK